jgi:Ca2+-binding EF-hand superfamily protein
MRQRITIQNVLPGAGQSIQSANLAPQSARTHKDTEKMDPPKVTDFGEATRLARTFHLDLWEVKNIMSEFGKGDENGSGGLDRDEFTVVLKNVMELKEVPEDMLDSAWSSLITAGATQQKGPTTPGEKFAWEASIDAFFAWYVANMFGHVTKARQDPGEEEVYRLSRRHNVAPVIIDKVKKRFDHFDADKSGVIDFAEFLEMLCVLLRCKNKDDLSESRVTRFWKEIDTDCSGEVSFEEFTTWYLKYFNPENEAMKGIDSGPVGQFYSSHNPQVQRRQSRNIAAVQAAQGMGLEESGALNSARSAPGGRTPRRRGSY